MVQNMSYSMESTAVVYCLPEENGEILYHALISFYLKIKLLVHFCKDFWKIKESQSCVDTLLQTLIIVLFQLDSFNIM